jgi:hypothetical protein
VAGRRRVDPDLDKNRDRRAIKTLLPPYSCGGNVNDAKFVSINGLIAINARTVARPEVIGQRLPGEDHFVAHSCLSQCL